MTLALVALHSALALPDLDEVHGRPLQLEPQSKIWLLFFASALPLDRP